MKNRRGVGLLNPVRCKKVKVRTGGGEGDDTCDHGLSRSWKVDECETNNPVDTAVEYHPPKPPGKNATRNPVVGDWTCEIPPWNRGKKNLTKTLAPNTLNIQYSKYKVLLIYQSDTRCIINVYQPGTRHITRYVTSYIPGASHCGLRRSAEEAIETSTTHEHYIRKPNSIWSQTVCVLFTLK